MKHIHFDSSHNTTSTHLPVIPALLHSLPKLAMVPLGARFSLVFGGRGRRCNWSHVISQHVTRPALSLIKSYCPHSLCHPLCHCCVCACICIYTSLCVCNYSMRGVVLLISCHWFKNQRVSLWLRPNESIFCCHVNIYFACSSQFIQDITMKCTVNTLLQCPILPVI